MLEQNKPVKKWHWYLLLLVIGLSLILKFYSYYWPKAQVTIGEKTIKVLVARDDRHWRKGLSSRKNLGKYDGMIFIFPGRGQHTMVMREMEFALDIVWLDGYKIVDIAPSVQPEPGKIDGQLIPYFSRLPSDMVLELPAGFAQTNRIKIGDAVKLVR